MSFQTHMIFFFHWNTKEMFGNVQSHNQMQQAKFEYAIECAIKIFSPNKFIWLQHLYSSKTLHYI